MRGDVVLVQGRLRGGSRKFSSRQFLANPFPPGNGERGGLVDRRHVSVRWFRGTILTALCGAALMGGAVIASLHGESNLAAAPERVETELHGALTSLGGHFTGGLHKTDRLPWFGGSNVVREVLRVPTVSHSEDREVVHVRPYERVFGNLSLTIPDPSANIPPFDPQKILADAVSGHDQAATPVPEAEVSFSTCSLVSPPQHSNADQAVCELSSLLPKVSSQLPLDDVMEQVRDAAKEAGIGAPQLVSDAGSMRLGYASDSEQDPYLRFAARVFPMNVTLLPKTQRDVTSDSNERIIAAKKGETVGSILRDLGATPDQIGQILAVLGPAASGQLKEGQRVRVLLAPFGLGRVLPERVIVEGDGAIEAAAALSDMHTYVPVDIRNVDSDSANQDESAVSGESQDGVTLYQSLYETALRNNVPRPVIDEMVRIYAYDVDFRRKVQPGDSFDVLYAEDTNRDGTHEVRYTSLTLGGETTRFYHFRTADDGQYDYYDDTGRSAKKFLVRKPVAVGVETSPFGWRIHPVLFFKEFHTGVDWGAPLGTPIFAAGDGTIEEIGLKSGYGKYVRVRHADGYETAYSHLTAFAEGLDVGSRVRQGRVIGFVGSTGISTGPHVLFEILLNGHFVDPMRVELPRGRVLDGGTLAQFEEDRHQLDALIGKPRREASR